MTTLDTIAAHLKPLEWHEFPSGNWFEAQTILGTYFIGRYADGKYHAGLNNNALGPFDTLDRAKEVMTDLYRAKMLTAFK